VAVVGAVHAAGVNHNDINPANIVLSDRGQLRLIDFSHSTLHDCLGKGRCPELLEVDMLVNVG
jgi:serine/threonine protein kinase